MIVCGFVFVGIFILRHFVKTGRWLKFLDKKERKYLFLFLIVGNLVATVMFAMEWYEQRTAAEIWRNDYGEGNRTEHFEVTLEGQLEEEALSIEIGAHEYNDSETKKMFKEVMKELDEVVLGKNESFDKIEYDLDLVLSLEKYPVDITWELDSYKALSIEGKILEDYAEEEGTVVELRGIITYAEQEAIYVRHAMVYPKAKTEQEQLLQKLKLLIQDAEKETREEEVFVLPDTIDGKKIEWKKEKDYSGYYILLIGIGAAGLIPVKKLQEYYEEKKKRQEQMMRDYPEIISKVTLLLSTGMTLRSVWKKIVQSYEEQKDQTGMRIAYEEMGITYRQMQGGISEKEAYERFGQRCGNITYMKFGALLSQNLKKGSKGLTQLLTMESIQAFEERKSMARTAGEEASTKLMLPMFGMLAVVLIMVVVPAFLSMQM